MFSIKNSKKPKKEEKSKDNEIEGKEEDVIEIEPEEKEETDNFQQNELFSFYFKFPLLIVKFYQGLQLKTNL